jgi:hypothetical protein
MTSKLPVTITLLFLLSGCFIGDENSWAGREDIVQAAARCGVANFEPTDAPGGAYAAYVRQEIPEAERKEECIYADLERQGLLATR